MVVIIELEKRMDGCHCIQSMDERFDRPKEGWILVPPKLYVKLHACAGCCDLIFKKGELVDLKRRPWPPLPKTDAMWLKLAEDYRGALHRGVPVPIEEPPFTELDAYRCT